MRQRERERGGEEGRRFKDRPGERRKRETEATDLVLNQPINRFMQEGGKCKKERRKEKVEEKEGGSMEQQRRQKGCGQFEHPGSVYK